MDNIELCWKCSGRGKWPKQELEDYHNNTWVTVGTEVCNLCGGSGRLIKTVSYEPFIEYEFKENVSD